MVLCGRCALPLPPAAAAASTNTVQRGIAVARATVTARGTFDGTAVDGAAAGGATGAAADGGGAGVVGAGATAAGGAAPGARVIAGFGAPPGGNGCAAADRTKQ